MIKSWYENTSSLIFVCVCVCVCGGGGGGGIYRSPVPRKSLVMCSFDVIGDSKRHYAKE